MIATHQDVDTSPSGPQAIDQRLEKQSLHTIIVGELEPVVAKLVKQALSNPAIWPGELPTTPVCSSGPSTPPLDADELQKQLVKITRDGWPSVELSMAMKPDRSSSASNEQDGIQVGIDLEHPIHTTPDDFKLFREWASICSFKTVVETWDKETCKYKIAEPVGTSSSLDDYAEYAFVVRERVERNSEMVIPYIDIKSGGLRDILRVVLHGIKAISLMEDKPSIEQNVLFHFLPELDNYAEDMNNPDCAFARQHLRLLIDHLKRAYSDIAQRLESMLQHGHITYDLLWALFKPGSHVFTTCFGTKEPRCVVFDAGEEVTQNDETWFNLECRFFDYDGIKFGEAGIFLRVAKFRGSKPIESLEAFPLRHHPNHEQVRKDLVGRGRKFRDLAGSHIRHCKGSAFFMNKGKIIKLNINSRVAVDAAFFHEMQPNYSRPSLRDGGVKDKNGITVVDIGAMLKEGREREKERMRGDGVDAQQLSETDLLVACPTACCFSFREKMFLECAVGALGEVDWSPQSFDCLQIPSDDRTLLLSLAKTRLGLIPTVPFDDVIDGKGQGLNILLNGPPGVGKTFTVEATSEYFKLPLYSISTGELVVDHGDSNALEQQLEAVFKIAKHFNAMLLLDEADAFMEQRTSYHDTHNRLVTVFLRKLEYYQGILFLTSNRGIQFDDAILSRIHLAIEYEDLTREFRRDLWSTFLSKARTMQGPAVVEERDLRRLESLALNGREIKNIAAIAHALAEADANQVSYRYLELAAKSNKRFSKEFGGRGTVDGMYL
ncbi:P-loop containing nucleoside triphosphate hydrolase protein [Aspergillus ibericus CBS 121593]|uniref:P-loop containing nucleoside triphosphate hydrolase protein n=1 Tax=Aspergillus ibericus CBS 121593 TaxID=1448316 RepID=A0A395GHQ4_9EURO|nr:P-loop containing nucleoside triphosphate hydrolase protein [Aspergillus ibericus CBS 121593]RAK94951.1 P-loop containing nucleoside triphosphate hydrolase protein [Aspergillus ibericus CBS 121593]